MDYIDTHAHLNFPQYDKDIEAVIERAQRAKVSKIIVVGTDLETSQKAVDLAQIYPSLYATVSIHPIYAVSYTHLTLPTKRIV